MKLAPLALLPVAALVLAGCAGTADPAADDVLRVVASTNVYGDIAEHIGGDLIEVTSIIDSPAQDPHSYEASARDRLALERADLVLENGGGYDPFVDQLLAASPAEHVVLTAVEIAGLTEGEHAEDAHAEGEHAEEGGDEHADDHDGHGHIEGVNEHVWYDLHVADEVAHQLAHELGELDPANADVYEANYEDWAAGYEVLHDRVHELEESFAGAPFALTEPVPSYLLLGIGLEDRTVPEFAEAVEEGTDVPPLALQQMLDIASSGDLALLAYNSQTAGPETEQVRAAAEAAGVPIVDVTETLPEGEDYLSWMTSNLDQIEAALTR